MALEHHATPPPSHSTAPKRLAKPMAERDADAVVEAILVALAEDGASGSDRIAARLQSAAPGLAMVEVELRGWHTEAPSGDHRLALIDLDGPELSGRLTIRRDGRVDAEALDAEAEQAFYKHLPAADQASLSALLRELVDHLTGAR